VADPKIKSGANMAFPTHHKQRSEGLSSYFWNDRKTTYLLSDFWNKYDFLYFM